MLNLSWLPDLAYREVITGFETPWSLYDGTSWMVGSLCAILNPDGSSPSYTTEQVPFGCLSQGKTFWGRLRDKDVLHVSAHGSVTLGSVSIMSTEWAAADHKVGRHYHSTSGYPSEFNILAVTPWGVNMSVDSELHSAASYSSKRGDVQPYSVPFTSSVAFDGDYAVAIVHQHTYSVVTQRVGTLVFDDSYRVRFYHRTVGGVGSVAASSETLVCGKEGSIWKVFLPNGHFEITTIMPYSAAYGVVYNYGEIIRDFTLPSGQSTAAFQVSQLKSILESPAFLGYISGVFGWNPVEDIETLWGDMGADCIKQQDYVDANLLLTAFDLLHLLEDIRSWKKLSLLAKRLAKDKRFVKVFCPRLIRGIRDWAQVFAHTYLGIQYGVLPTVRDTQALAVGMAELYKVSTVPTRKHARRSSINSSSPSSPISSELVLTVEVGHLPRDLAGSAMEWAEQGMRWGLFSTYSTAWDAIPFSFVVDWFLDIGSAAKSLDTEIRKQYFPVLYVMQGVAREWSPSLPWLWPELTGLSGSVVFRHYTRYCSRDLPTPPIQIGWGSGSISHWAEGGSLLVTKMPRV